MAVLMAQVVRSCQVLMAVQEQIFGAAVVVLM